MSIGFFTFSKALPEEELLPTNPSACLRRHLPYEGEAQLPRLPFVGELAEQSED